MARLKQLTIKHLILGAALVWIFWIFVPVFTQSRVPVPFDAMIGLYHPFRDAWVETNPNGVAYRNYLITDAFRQQYAYREFAIDQFKQAQIPWWNPYNFTGTPLLATYQGAVFYPLNLIFWLLDFVDGWTILVISQAVIALLGIYFWLRSEEISEWASGLAGLVWIGSGPFIVWLEWNTVGHVMAWSPWILLAINRLANPKLKQPLPWSFFLVFALLAQVFAGYPQPWLFFSLLQVSYLGFKLYPNLKQKSPRPIIRLVSPYLLVMCVSLIQLLPSLEFADLSNRLIDQGDLLSKPDWFVPKWQLLQLIIPDFFGNPAKLNYWGVFNYTEFTSSIGVIPFAFGLGALFQIRSKPTKLLIWLSFWTGLSMVMAVRNPISVLPFIWDLPLLGSSQPSRWLLLFSFVMAVLVGLGFDHWLKSKNKFQPHLVLVPGMVLITVWLIILLKPAMIPDLTNNLSVAKRNTILPSLEWLSLCLIIVVIGLNKWVGKLTPKTVNWFALPLVFIIMFTQARLAQTYLPMSPREFIYPQTETTNFLQANLGHYRFMSLDERLLPPNVNLAYRLQSIEGYDPLYLAEYGRLFAGIESAELPDQSPAHNRILTTSEFDSPIIDLLGVKYILSLNDIDADHLELVHQEGETKIYQNNRVMPRAFWVEDLSDWPPSDVDPAEIIRYEPNQVEVYYQASQSGYLVLTDAYYPSWQVEVNNQPQTLESWNGLRVTILPEGEHEIRYNYRYSQL